MAQNCYLLHLKKFAYRHNYAEFLNSDIVIPECDKLETFFFRNHAVLLAYVQAKCIDKQQHERFYTSLFFLMKIRYQWLRP